MSFDSALQLSPDDSAGSLSLGEDDTTITYNGNNDIKDSFSSSDNSSLDQKMEGAHVSPRGKNKEERKEKKKRSSTISSKKGGGSKKYWEGIFPSIMYTWQDLNDNELVTVEVHMPSGSISSEFHLELEQDHPNEPQVLVIKYRVGACFFNEDAFNSFINDVVQNGRDASSMAQSRHNKIIEMKKNLATSMTLQTSIATW